MKILPRISESCPIKKGCYGVPKHFLILIIKNNTGFEITVSHRTLTDGEPILSNGSFLSLDTMTDSEL